MNKTMTFNWDEMIRWLFTMMKHKINNTEWVWDGDEREGWNEAKPKGMPNVFSRGNVCCQSVILFIHFLSYLVTERGPSNRWPPVWRTRIVCFKSNLLLSIQMYNTSFSSLHMNRPNMQHVFSFGSFQKIEFWMGATGVAFRTWANIFLESRRKSAKLLKVPCAYCCTCYFLNLKRMSSRQLSGHAITPQSPVMSFDLFLCTVKKARLQFHFPII